MTEEVSLAQRAVISVATGVKKEAEPLRDAALVSVPSRAAVSVLDMNTFSPGVPGGGNLGFALDVPTVVQFERPGVLDAPAKSEHRATPEQRRLIAHCIATWSSVVPGANSFAVEVLESPTPHIGLASSSALQATMYAGLNWLYGLPLSEPELLALLYGNYKEVVGGDLVDGFTTGLSGGLNFYGGFVYIDPALRIVRHMSVPTWNYVVAVPADQGSCAFGQAEAELLMGEGRRLDERDRKEKLRLIDEVLLPAIASRDLGAIGHAIHAVQALGNKQCEIELYGESMIKTLEQLQRSDAACAFLSAVGPAIVILSDHSLDSVHALLEECSFLSKYSGKLDDVGIKIRGGIEAHRLAARTKLH